MDLSFAIYSIKSTFLDSASVFIQDFYLLIVFVSILLIGILLGRKKALKLFLGIIIVFVVASLIKDFFIEARPCQVYALKSVECLSTQGFPSIHAGVAGVFIFMLFDSGIAFLVFLLSLIVMFSRVFIGAHTISQVVAGFCLGIICCKLADLLGDKIDKFNDWIQEAKHSHNLRVSDNRFTFSFRKRLDDDLSFCLSIVITLV